MSKEWLVSVEVTVVRAAYSRCTFKVLSWKVSEEESK